MFGIPKCIKGCLTYPTASHVVVHDVRLGCIYYVLVILIFIYVVISKLFYKGGYALIAEVEGLVDLTVFPPTFGNCDPRQPTCEETYRNKTDLPYCLQSAINRSQDSGASSVLQLPCRYYDGNDVMQRMTGTILLATYIADALQERVCDTGPNRGESVWSRYRGGDLKRGTVVSVDDRGQAALRWDDGSLDDRTKFASELMSDGDRGCSRVWSTADRGVQGNFVADIERFTVGVHHSVNVPSLDISFSGRDHVGWLSTKSERMCTTHPRRSTFPAQENEKPVLSNQAPCYIKPEISHDHERQQFFSLGTLLGAAGFDLDDRDPSMPNRSLRKSGVHIMLTIEYNNFVPWVGITPINYILSVSGSSEHAKVIKAAPLGDQHERRLRTSGGIELEVVQLGHVYRYSWTALILNLAAGLTMVTMVTLMVDMFATYVYTHREKFSKLKYPEAESFDEATSDTSEDHDDRDRVGRVLDKA